MTDELTELSKQDFEALAHLRHVLRVFLHFSEEAARDVGLTPQQHQALLAIHGYPGRDELSVKELAERLQIRHHSAVGLCNRLEAQELIQRRHDSADKRSVKVKLSRNGLQLLKRLSIAHRDEIARLGQALSQSSFQATWLESMSHP